jgi:hypothetical protein
MTDKPVNLDTHRSADSQIAVEFRRHESRTCSPDNLSKAPTHDAALQSQLLAGPADSWPDIARKAIFLLDRYAATSAAQDMRVQVLIKRALCDMARLTRREERKP